MINTSTEGVREMREARLGMVQTKEQYVFAYLAVLEQTEVRWLAALSIATDVSLLCGPALVV